MDIQPITDISDIVKTPEIENPLAKAKNSKYIKYSTCPCQT